MVPLIHFFPPKKLVLLRKYLAGRQTGRQADYLGINGWSLQSKWLSRFLLELCLVSKCLPFMLWYSNCMLLRVKMESIYIYSVFIWGRHSGLVECLSYWHTCCVSNGFTETQWHWLRARSCATHCLSVSTCPRPLMLLPVDSAAWTTLCDLMNWYFRFHVLMHTID